MQFTQADSNIRRVGVQENLIKFRPSPNFKNMKKFLKQRNQLAEQSLRRSPTPEPQPPPQAEQNAEVTEEHTAEVKPVVVQPPLPPYPPPPDSPPNLNIVIKRERKDEDDNLQNNEPQPSTSLTQVEQETSSTRPQRTIMTMCKEFIRGDCKRSICRYSHELDLTQLPGVFTFCWNYQNTKCSYPYCKFVHATVWEEAEFYRTGQLPPHARNHMKKALPAPPPINDGAGPSNYVAVNQQPSMHPGPSMEKPMGPFGGVLPTMEQRPITDYPSTSANSSPMNQEWSRLGEFSSSPRDLETEHLSKNCNNCEFSEYRLQYYKEKVDAMMQSRKEMSNKMGILNEKSNKLSLVLLTLMKPGNYVKAGSSTGSTGGDKEKAMLDQLGHFISTNNRLSGAGKRDDIIKNTFGGGSNMSNLMAKFFCGNGEQPLAIDALRES